MILSKTLVKDDSRYDAGEGNYVFWCPGCECGHVIFTSGENKWELTQNEEGITVTPSLKIMLPGGKGICHVVVSKSKLNYCNDSTHKFKGQSIDMVDWDNV